MNNLNSTTSFPLHPTIELSNILNNICRPLFFDTCIDFFGYAQQNMINSSFVYISSDIKLQSYYVMHKPYNHSSFRCERKIYNKKMTLLDGLDEKFSKAHVILKKI